MHTPGIAPRATRARRRFLSSAAALGTAGALAFSGLVASPAFADDEATGKAATPNPAITVTPNSEIDGTVESTLDLSGTGYATTNANGENYGGAYILFGVVTPADPEDSKSWGPSTGGASGKNYDYAPGAGTNQTMVNYPGNETEPDVPYMDADGNWSSQILIPGAKFTSQAGNEIDCYTQQCGVITIGAHGQAQGGVEAFTPVTFAEPQPATETTTVVVTQESGSYPTDYAGQDVKVSSVTKPAEAAGSVEFFVGDKSLGKATAKNGAASITTKELAGGEQKIKAVFTPTDSAEYAASTSAEQIYRIVDLTPAVADIELGTEKTKITDATLNWGIANWFSFHAGPKKSVVSGDVTLEEMPEDTAAEELVKRDFIFTKGTGAQDTAGNRVVKFTGTVRFTSGTSPVWTIADPEVHTNAAGDGYIVADLKTDFLQAEWGGEDEHRTPGRIVITTFKGGTFGSSDQQVTYDATPIFEGQTATGTWATGFDGATVTNQFLSNTNSGVRNYLVQTGASADPTKQAEPVRLSFAESASLPFTDVDSGSVHYPGIQWVYDQGITTGTSADKFSPKKSVTRAQMALFLYRLAGEPDVTLPEKSPFPDLDPSARSYKAINWLVQEEITNGVKKGGKLIFDGSSTVTRGQMSAFLYRYSGSPEFEAPEKSSIDDVPVSNVFYKEISWLADRGITTPYTTSSGDVVFRPKNDVLREQMATFLYRLETNE